jgi:putative PIN family toxin of toxin-antitoxin system
MADSPGVVLDTGIVLQAGLRPLGPAGQLVSLIDQNLFTLYLSEPGVEEYADVLHRPSIRAKNPQLTDDLATAIAERIRIQGVLLPAVPDHFHYPRDPDDEHVVNLAIEAKAQFLVSRDKDLLDLMHDEEFHRRYPDLTILDPVTFLHELARMQHSEGQAAE